MVMPLIKDKLKHVPHKPGSYQMKDAEDNIIYVGKAKDLKNRLSSYFTGSHDYKTTKMLTQVVDFDIIITASELEAFILELDLIKKYQPRYNILLTDDKSYPYIEITKEKHPKLVVTRRVKKKHRNLFGPYPNVKAARDTIKILNKLYPLRKCQKLPNEPCLYYHLGQCLAPCINKVEQESYRSIESDIRAFLKGKTGPVVHDLKQKMYHASDNLEFEKASEYKALVEAIETTTKTKQAVNITDERPLDVIGVASDDHALALVIFFIRHGKISASDKRIFNVDHDQEQALSDFLAQFYRTYPTPQEIIMRTHSEQTTLESLLDVKLHVPKRGTKRQLLDLAVKNAEETLKQEKASLKHRHAKTFGVLDELGELLDIKTPYRIEAYDNAHLFGTHPVSAKVVFQNAKPDKHSYRKYKLDEPSKQAGDTDHMREVLYRRFRRLLMDEEQAPDLILLDGGIAQLNVAKQLKQDFGLSIPLATLVKNDKHKTSNLLDEDGTTTEIKPNSELFKFLSRIQEEAHRFAVTFHQQKRHQGLFASKLDDVKGVGPKTKQTLLKTYKTTEMILNADHEELKALGINETTIKNIKATLKNS